MIVIYLKLYYGAVHKVRHAIFGQFCPPLPLSHSVIHPEAPQKYVTHLEPPRFLVVPSTKNPDKSPLYKISLNCSRKLLSGGFCPRVFCLEGFVPGWILSVPLLSEYICYNRKLKITLNFMFHMYMIKKIISVTSHALDHRVTN